MIVSFKSFAFGLNGLWATRVTDNVSLNFGFTYDYYHVSGASATTYLNAAYYENLFDYGYITEDEYYEHKSNGWKTESKNEIESVYKSMGIRVGLNIKF